MSIRLRRSAPLAVAAMLALASAGWAGGPGPEERLLVLGHCDGEVRRKAKQTKALAGACRDGLVPGIDAAIVAVDALRAI